jgi:hypothetical protein
MASTNVTTGRHGGIFPKGTSTLINTKETLGLLRDIGSIRWKEVILPLDEIFLYDMFGKAAKYGDGLIVTDRQLDRVKAIHQSLKKRKLLP